jgi:hypothetical protein
MVAQLEKAVDAQRHDKMTIQVMPFDIGAYAAAEGYFVLLDFEEASDLSPVVFIEGLTGNKYLERDADIARYRETIDYLHKLALSLQDSVQDLHHAGRAHRGHQLLRVLGAPGQLRL